MDDLLRRVARLEAENRRWKRLGLAMLLGVSFLLLAGAGPRRGSVFTVNTLRVVDSSGRVRAKLTVQNGEPGLLLLDDKGVVRTAHCALGWMRADARGKRRVSVGKPSCVPTEAAQAPIPNTPLPAEKE